MATGDQLKSLIKSYFEGDKDRFVTTTLQVAAHEARQGHSALARDIRNIVDKANTSKVKVISFTPDLSDLIITSEPKARLEELVVFDELKEKINRIIKEYFQRAKLLKHGLSNRRKILLVGPPGTGKTMTASILAHKLELPFCTIQVDKLINKYMGETSAKLRQIFDIIQDKKGVFLFDEFDAIGAERNSDNDVGEMRRVLNSFLQFLENDESESLIIAATNNIGILDQALFDDILYYQLPNEEELIKIIDNCLGSYKGTFHTKNLISEANNLSHAEITQACYDAIKEVILNDKQKVTKNMLYNMIKDRKKVYKRD